MVAPVLDTMTEGKVELSELVDVGKKLSHPSSSKETLCNALEQASVLFSAIQQLPHVSVLSAMNSSMDALVQPALLKHKDKDIRMLVTACISEIMRIVAPDAPYSDDILKEIFELIVASFKGLNDKESRFFEKRLKILESVATVQSCLVMLDLECDDLIREMFQAFFSTVSEEPKSVILAMRAIMCSVLEESEEIPLPLLEVLLRNLLHGRKGVSNAGYTLARAVFKRCTEYLTPHVESFLISTISEGKLYKSKWRESYHDLIFEISKIDPKLIHPVIPKLRDELQVDKLDVRLRAVRLVGRLLASLKGLLPEDFNGLFVELVSRFSDTAIEVRLAVIEFGKHYLLANPSGPNAEELLAAFCDCLGDQDAGVKGQVVAAICECAKSNFESSPVINTLKKASECLWDTEVSLRRETFRQLTELYRSFCSKISEGTVLQLESFCWIPCKLISCCSDGEPKDFRAQAMEMIFSEQLFPVEFSTEDRVKCWIVSFDAFDNKGLKALERILFEKQRLHLEMRNYLCVVSKLKDKESQENERELQEACKSMASFFDEPAKAELQLQNLSQLKDTKLLKIIDELLDSKTSLLKSSCLREDLLKSHGENDIEHDFLRALAIRCSFALFHKEHMQDLLTKLKNYRSLGDQKMLQASLGLLLVITRHSPSLLEGAEADVLDLLKDDRSFIKDGVVEILAKIGGSVRGELLEEFNSVNLLEKLCMEGSCKQAKYAVQALSALSGNLESEVLTTLYGKLLDRLDCGVNLPTTLQSLGFIAQHSSSSFKAYPQELLNFLMDDLLKRDSELLDGENIEQNGASVNTRLKVSGLKSLVRSFLPINDCQHIEPPKELFEILLKLLKIGEISDEIKSSDVDKAHLRLAAANVVLRLSRCYDQHIPPQLFHATVLRAKDPSDFVKLRFMKKVYKGLMEQAVSTKYASALALSIDDGSVEDAKFQLRDYVKSARIQIQSRNLLSTKESEKSLVVYYPEYVLFYLVHALAQEVSFPSLNDGGPSLEAVEPVFRQLYLFIWALLCRDGEETGTDSSKEDDLDRIALIFGILCAMKNADDALDASKTENTCILCDLCITLIKDLVGDEFANLKVVDNIPLPLPIYRDLEETAEANQKVDKTYLPSFFEESDAFSKLKCCLPFGIDMVVKQRKRKADSGSLRDIKTPLHKRSKVVEVSQGEEGHKRGGSEKVEPVETEVNVQGTDMTTPVSPKRKRGSQYSNDNGEVSSPETRPGRVDEKSSRKPKVLKVSIDEVEDVKHGGTPAPELVSPVGSATKRVCISIKKPKLPPKKEDFIGIESAKKEDSTAVVSPKKEDVSELKKRGRKKVMDGLHDDGLHDDGLHHVGTDEAQTNPLTSPRGTPRRSVKNVSGSGLESPISRVEEEKASIFELVGCKIRVWWPRDKQFYQGVIESYDSQRKKHKVVYDDGDVELLNLSKERWEMLKNAKESPGSPSAISHVEHGLQSKEKKVDLQSRSSKGTDRRRSSGKQLKSKNSPSSTKHAERERDVRSNASNDTETVEQGDEMGDGEETPSSVSKRSKMSEKNNSAGKRTSLKNSNHKSDINKPVESPSTQSKDSKDSGDVPLRAWKSGRRKAQ